MNYLKTSTLTFALLGGLALAGCDGNVETAGVDADPANTTAMGEPTQETPQDNTLAEQPPIDTGNGMDDTRTMGDVQEPYDPYVEDPADQPMDPREDPMTTDPESEPENDPLDEPQPG